MRSVRVRITALLVLALILGYNAPRALEFLVDNGVSCSNVGLSQVCYASVTGRSALYFAAVLVVLAAFAVVLHLLSVWCVRPVRDLVEVVARIGPQNLGYRIRPARTDDVGRLSAALDAMMDRIAAGYEGQRRFAANASHELRTPLAVQRTLIEVGLSEGVTPDQLSLLTRQLLATNERNERLIEGLLVLSEADQGLVARTPQRLDDIVAEVLAAYAGAAQTAQVGVHVDTQPRVVLGERVLLERLVTNLVQNAVKYNRPGGELWVRVSAGPDALTVRNTGVVVPAEAVAGLFEPFRRLVGERINHDGGAGLGLTIARSIVQAHDGLIAARPADPDGLEVGVMFPPA